MKKENVEKTADAPESERLGGSHGRKGLGRWAVESFGGFTRPGWNGPLGRDDGAVDSKKGEKVGGKRKTEKPLGVCIYPSRAQRGVTTEPSHQPGK